MKHLNLYLITVLLLCTSMFTSCDNNDGYSLGDIGSSWATVKIIQGDTYYLESDRYGSLWIAADAARWYKPVNGQRVVSYFNPLADNYDKYDMAIKLDAIYPILTKGIVELTPKNEKDLGNDPIVIFKNNLWISGGYLNIIFRQNTPYDKKHFINLVSTTTSEEDTEYIHLQLRYNTYNDLSGYWQNGAVSFNLNTLNFEGKKGIILKINSEQNGETDIQIDFNTEKREQNRTIENSVLKNTEFN